MKLRRDPRRDWFVVSMDDGIVRRERTKRRVLDWALTNSDGRLISSRRRSSGSYDCQVGYDAEHSRGVWIMRGDVAAEEGWDITQRPLYPHEDRPGLRVDREET